MDIIRVGLTSIVLVDMKKPFSFHLLRPVCSFVSCFYDIIAMDKLDTIAKLKFCCGQCLVISDHMLY